MILYIENPKATTEKTLKLINEFSKDSGYKINTQKSVKLLYTDSKLSEREILRRQPHFHIKKNKNLGINVNKEVKDLYSENYETLMKKMIEGNTDKWKDMPCA